jgi:uncharacterized CHY-type Zn-finger protein
MTENPRKPVHGLDVDAQTRCAHWRSPLDIVAIRIKCCGVYYACKDCHEALAGHPIEVWPPDEWDRLAVMCGACGAELAIAAYLASSDACPACHAPFNPGCRLHRRFYFETA